MSEHSFRNGPPRPRAMGRVNWRGFWTLYRKEVLRFVNVGMQTVLAPMITALIFFAIFNLALGRAMETAMGVPYAQFLAPGLMMMTLVQNAFANTSSSLLISKVQGNIVDVLMPPLSPAELTLGYALGGVTRGLLVAFAVWVALTPFIPLAVHSLFLIVFYATMAALMLALVGLIAGIWADKFDHVAAVQNFVITPLSFLSGTFYTLDRLPESWHIAAFLDPFFYMIDGLRYGFIGTADGDPWTGAVLVVAVNAVLLAVAHRMMARGYKLKA